MSERQNMRAKEKVWRAFFIDSENGLGSLLYGYDQLRSSDLIVVFHRGNISDKLRKQLESSSAQIDWVKCGNPGLKNSMDFHIVAELSARLALNEFSEGYVVSGDKGFRAAVQHLEKLSIAQGHELACVKDILHGIFLSKHRVLLSLEGAETCRDIQHCFELVFNDVRAKKIMERITEIIEYEAAEKAAPSSVHEPMMAVYEVPCEALEVTQPIHGKKSVARKALHGFIQLLYLAKNRMPHLSNSVEVGERARS